MTEVFLDETPGETRGVVVRDGWAEYLLIQRDSDPATHRLGARSIGRVAEVVPGLRGAFVVLAEGSGFLPTKADGEVKVGEKIEVVVTAEPRGGKGPTLKRQGAGQGEVRLLAAGPTVALGLMRRGIAYALDSSLEDAMLREAGDQRTARGTADSVEGGMAFLGKRKPAFRGA